MPDRPELLRFQDAARREVEGLPDRAGQSGPDNFGRSDGPDGPDGPYEHTIERTPRRGVLWVSLAVAAAVVAVGIVGAVWGAGDDADQSQPDEATQPTTPPLDDDSDADGDSPPQPQSEEPQSEEPQFPDPIPPEADGAGPDAGSDSEADVPARALDDVRPALGDPLPTSIDPLPLPEGVILIGHGPSGRMAAVDATGQVTELVGVGGPGFIPVASNGDTLIGLINAGAGAVALRADGSVTSIQVDNRDAPIYLASPDGGYFRHGTWLGVTEYLDPQGQPIAEGPPLARGTRTLGHTTAGLLVLALDETAILLDPNTGALLRRLPSVPHAVGGDTVVVTACDDGAVCRSEIQSIDGDVVGMIDVDPALLDRVVLSVSPNGELVAHRGLEEVRIVEATGELVATFDVAEIEFLAWLPDRGIVVGSNGVYEIWHDGLAAPAPLELGDAIDPLERGLHPLRAVS